MRKKINLSLALMLLSAVITMAQELKSFTLDDLIPGGSNYYNCSIKNLYGVQWWGDRCIVPDAEEVKTVNPRNGKETLLFTLYDINEGLMAYTGAKLPRIYSLYDISFPEPDRPIVRFRSQDYMIYYNFEYRQVDHLVALGKGAANLDMAPGGRSAAYTVGDQLFVSPSAKASDIISLSPEFADPATAPADHDLVYGQAVHRNEFGIMKGTFWSPRGARLAFYRMDQSMVTDYPQVDVDTRIATLVPDKYPMAGMTSHKVTVGVYDLASGKTVYLDAGDPTDRYFTNISWSPDEQKVYMIELNRDQNYAQLVRYDAATGKREAVIYEEMHPKYVEPQFPLTFLPWDDTKFIYQSQRDGYNHLYLFDTSSPVAPKVEQSANGGTYKESFRVTQLTEGDWLVQSIVGFNEKKKEVYITSTEISPMQTNTYAVNVKTTRRRPVGNSEGVHSVQLSSDGNYLIDNYSTPDVPRRFYVAERGQEIVGVAGISDSTERAVYTDARALRINFGFWKGLLAKLVLKLEFEGRLPYPPTTGFIEFVAVRKVYRRRGIAFLLLQESMVKAGYQEYALDVMAENVSARNCYEKLGFHAFKSAGKKVFMRLERPHAV